MGSPRRSSDRWFPALLLILALLDLRTELLLLRDHVTVTAVSYAIRHHALAIVVLCAIPSLWRRYGPRSGD
ncbi:MAG: hypothetical protein EBZ29_00335 [Synechococcaceae bacterium WB9_4xC_028]|uniref:hypothetical protein n=1 Tax=Synechococcus sp. BS56D TaxID=2055944 RepID=UPI00103CD093|nr:hypothetical protein [Synechococcus sp. BS56D]NDD44507.1 hypothetical protein [Synechococcaceae bacterium WB9_4xB_025]NDD67875.1 hypothetical protein [Synechococcaceae bacterium WB9_4xC_028]TCD58615.1 hypothetical protein CWE17_05935 [Synechococcus sp. BS56D]